MAEQNAPLSGPDFSRGVASAEVEEGRTLLGHADGEQVLLARCDGKLYAVGARCTHYGGPLEEGLVVGDTVRCPWHHAAFNLKSGRTVRPPALHDLPRWQVEERDGRATIVSRLSDPGRETRELPDAPSSVLIIGGGAAGAVAAVTLRREGYEGAITILDEGSSPPCDRPNLSKDYLAGTAPEEWIPLFPDSFYEEHRIDVRLGSRVESIETDAGRVILADGATHEYGALLIATGASPVTLPLEHAEGRVKYLRTLSDSREIIAAAESAKKAVVIGASFIGLEVAASLRARGLEVTVVAPETRPLERVLGAELGDFIRALHEEKGVHFELGQTATAIDASHLTIANGKRLPADLIVAGIGVRPNIGIAERSGLDTDRGILVDEFLETSAKGVFAAGDVARWPDPRGNGEKVRIEHWVVAERQAVIAARNILGLREPFHAVPFFWSQHYDVTIAYVGHAAKWERTTVDGDMGERDCAVRYLDGDRVLALATIFRDNASLEMELEMERLASREFPVPA